MDPKDVARIMASVVAQYLKEGNGAIKDILLTDIIPKTAMLLQEAVEVQPDLELLDDFQALQMRMTDPFSFQPYQGARGGPSQVGGGHFWGKGGYAGGGSGHS